MRSVFGDYALDPQRYESYGVGKAADRPEVAEARQRLVETYDWFTEVFAIAALQEAKTWLALLEAEPGGKGAEP